MPGPPGMPCLRALGWGHLRARRWHVRGQPQPRSAAAGGFLVTLLWDQATSFQQDLPKLLIYCGTWLSRLDPCHHVTSTSGVFPLGAALERSYCAKENWALHVPKYPCPAANVPRCSGNTGCQGPPSPLLGVLKSMGIWGRCPRGSRCQVWAGAEDGGMCGPSAMERSVETDGALSQSSVFSWGCKMWGSAIKMGVSTLFNSRDNSRFFRKS